MLARLCKKPEFRIRSRIRFLILRGERMAGEQSGGKVDHFLIRVKDILLIAGSLGAFSFWILGIVNLPDKVKRHEQRIEMLETRAAQNDINVSSIQKDLQYLTRSMDEIKEILKSRLFKAATSAGGVNR